MQWYPAPRAFFKLRKLPNLSDEYVHSMSFSPEGDRLAVAVGSQVQAGRLVYLLDPNTGRIACTFPADGDVAWPHSEQAVLAPLRDRTIGLVDPSTGQRIRTLATQDTSQCLAVSAMANVIAGGGRVDVRVIDLAGREIAHFLHGHTRSAQAIALSPDGRLVATRSFGELRVWDVGSNSVVFDVELAGPVSAHGLAFSPDGHCLASSRGKEAIGVWEVPSGKLLQSLEGKHCYTGSLAFSPAGDQVATGGQDSKVRVWDLRAPSWPQVLEGCSSWARAIAYSPDGQLLVGGDLACVRVWASEASPGALPQPPTAALTRPNARTRSPFLHQDVASFEVSLGAIAWFSRLGEPSSWDTDCQRIHSWDEWPGPEERGESTLSLQSQSFYDDVFGTGSKAVSDVFHRVQKQVLDCARNSVPYDEAQDPYHGPTNAVRSAAFACDLIACHLEVGWDVPEDLQELWAWLRAGHWPSGYAGSVDVSAERSGCLRVL